MKGALIDKRLQAYFGSNLIDNAFVCRWSMRGLTLFLAKSTSYRPVAQSVERVNMIFVRLDIRLVRHEFNPCTHLIIRASAAVAFMMEQDRVLLLISFT